MLPFAGTFSSEYGTVVSLDGNRDTATPVSSAALETPLPREATADTLLTSVCMAAQASPDTAANAKQAASASSIGFLIGPFLSKAEINSPEHRVPT
jgi:hypothetical protein